MSESAQGLTSGIPSSCACSPTGDLPATPQLMPGSSSRLPGLAFEGGHPTGPHRGQDTHSQLRSTRTKGNLLFGDQREAQVASLCRGRGTVAGCCLTEESGQAVPHSGPPRDGVPNPLTALCIAYVPAALVSTPGDPSRDTTPGYLLSVYLLFHFYTE